MPQVRAEELPSSEVAGCSSSWILATHVAVGSAGMGPGCHHCSEYKVDNNRGKYPRGKVIETFIEAKMEAII